MMMNKLSIALILVILLSGCKAQVYSQGVPNVDQNELTFQDNDSFELEARMIEKEINGKQISMYGYNSQFPGPILRVKQGSNLTVNFKNSIDLPTSVHWHGIRLENKYDGVPNLTQKEIMPGESFVYVLDFPDGGIYWYHPHSREDIQQELGLYGAIIVESNFTPVDKEEVLFLDDILVGRDGNPVSFYLDAANFAMSGRFGNLMLVNGMTNYSLAVLAGEKVRLYLINSANSRTFNFRLKGADFKIIGGDSGLYENEVFAQSVILGPSERAILDVQFSSPGTYEFVNSIPGNDYHLGNIVVQSRSEVEFSLSNHSIIDEGHREQLARPVDVTWQIGVRMAMGHMHQMGSAIDGIEWEDSMPMMNAMATSQNTKWFIKDVYSGKENMDIMYDFRKGDIKKIRIINDPDASHAMQHPIHIHGQRFLVTSIDGVANKNLVWKDTVLVPSGKTVEILVLFDNPGSWMFHCHIAEHLESGMMGVIHVD